MVIDSRYNNGYNNGYNYNDNYIYGKVLRKGVDYVQVSDNYSSKTYVIDASISISGISEGYPYYFKVSDKNGRPKLIAWYDKEPSDFRNNSRYGYDKTITISYFRYSSSRDEVYVTDNNNNDYYLNSSTNIDGYYYRSYSSLKSANDSDFRGTKADITIGSNGYISKIYFYGR